MTETVRFDDALAFARDLIRIPSLPGHEAELLHRCEHDAARGTAENPVTLQHAEKKSMDLLAPVLGSKRAQTLITTLANIDGVANVRALRKLYMK